MKNRPLRVSVLILLSAFVFSGCESAKTAGPVTLAVFIPGVLQGSPTYEQLDAGVRRAAAEVPGTVVKTIEGGYNQAQWGEQIATLAASGEYTYIVSSNPAMPEICGPAASAYPKQKFIILESTSTGSAFATLAYNHHDLAYLHGVLAGLMAKANGWAPAVGLIAGQEYPDMNNGILPGLEEGFQSVIPGGKAEFLVVGNWYDAGKGSELAKTLFAKNIGTVLTIAGGANQGVLTAAKQAGKTVLWYDADGYALEPGVVVGSGIIQQEGKAYDLIKQALAGTLEFGKPSLVGLKEGALDYLTASDAFRAAVPASVAAEFEVVVARFRSGQQ